jgi:MFS transporter, FSR family, fosmidomycin resistance protein
LNSKVIGILSLGHLTVDIGAGALPALLPFFQAEFHCSYFWLAALVMTSGITSSIMQPIFGVASDNLRTRFLLPIAVFLALAGYAGMGVAPSYGAVMILVALAGLGSAMYHPEATKSARAMSGHLPGTSLSLFAVGGNIGVAIGPVIITVLVAWRGLSGTWTLIIPALLVALVVATVVPAVSRAHEEHEARVRMADIPSARHAISVLVAVTALRSMVYAGVLTFVPLYAVNVLHQPVNHNAFLLFLFLGTGAAANLAAGPIADRHGAKLTMSLGLALAPFALALYLLSSGILAWIGLALAGAVLIGTFSTTVVMGMEAMPNRVALASALLIGLSTGLGGLGVGLLGKIADGFGLSAALWSLVAVSAVAYALTYALPKPRPELHFATDRLASGL